MQPKRGGFTIIETLIVLTVSSVLFFSVMNMLSGRQGRVQFSQGMRELESQIGDLLNDVSTGFYPNIPGLKCTADHVNNKPQLSIVGSGDSTGLNGDCVFAGKVFQIGLTNSGGNLDPSRVVQYIAAGRRLYWSSPVNSDDVDSIVQLKPTIMQFDSAQSEYSLPAGIEMVNNAGNPFGRAIGVFFSDYAGETSGSLHSGAASVAIAKISDTGSGVNVMQKQAIYDAVEALDESSFLGDGSINLCFKSGSSDAKAVISIAGSGGSLTTSLRINVDLTAPGAPQCN